jgi:hypothetical protein
MTADRTGQGRARYTGTYTRRQNTSIPRGRRGGVTWYLAATFSCAATMRWCSEVARSQREKDIIRT